MHVPVAKNGSGLDGDEKPSEFTQLFDFASFGYSISIYFGRFRDFLGSVYRVTGNFWSPWRIFGNFWSRFFLYFPVLAVCFWCRVVSSRKRGCRSRGGRHTGRPRTPRRLQNTPDPPSTGELDTRRRVGSSRPLQRGRAGHRRLPLRPTRSGAPPARLRTLRLALMPRQNRQNPGCRFRRFGGAAFLHTRSLAIRGLRWNRTLGRPPSRARTVSDRIQLSSSRHWSASRTTRGSVSPVHSLR